MDYKTITPAELDARLKRGDEFFLIDVREPVEHEIARIEGAQLLPLSICQEWAGALDPDAETVVMCHHGIRSAMVCAFLANKGFTNLSNLEGGIDRWSDEVDPRVPRY
jgi:rhodanese-related sulfurtransferase